MRSSASARPVSSSPATGSNSCTRSSERPQELKPIAKKAIRQPTRGAPVGSPKGIAFEIGDLLLAQAWAVANDVSMRIELDHGSRSEQYEEAISIQPGSCSIGRVLVWRSAASVFVQPLVGRRRRYASVARALDSLTPADKPELTDIVAKSWPKD